MRLKGRGRTRRHKTRCISQQGSVAIFFIFDPCQEDCVRTTKSYTSASSELLCFRFVECRAAVGQRWGNTLGASGCAHSLKCVAPLQKISASSYELLRIPRSREVLQSWVSTVFTTLRASLRAFPLVFQIRPDLVSAP